MKSPYYKYILSEPKLWFRYRKYEWQRRHWEQSPMQREFSDISNPLFRFIGGFI